MMGRLSHVAQMKNIFSRKPSNEVKQAEVNKVTATGLVTGDELEREIEASGPRDTNNVSNETCQDGTSTSDTAACQDLEDDDTLIRYPALRSFIRNNEEVLPLRADSLNMETLHDLERSLIREQDAIAEKCQLEKAELWEEHTLDKTCTRRAFESQKTELLRELETQQRIMGELTTALKQSHQQDLERLEREMQTSIRQHQEELAKLQTMLKGFLIKIENVSHCEVECPLEHVLREIQVTCKEHFDSTESRFVRSLDRCLESASAIAPQGIKGRDNTEHEHGISSSEKRTLCDNSNESEESEIQQEINMAYKKQKNELLQLFAEEKEALQSHLERAKVEFESKTRSEYEKRTLIERRAWQDTIQEYEREISILRFEREQMDRNYCLEMDKLKTEFEKEKLLLRRSFVYQLKDTRGKSSDPHRIEGLKSLSENQSESLNEEAGSLLQ